MLTDIQLAKLYINKYNQAKSRNIEFNLSFKKYKQLHRIKKCQITGIEFINKTQHDYSRTIDRVDNNLGYIDSNVIVCCQFINFKKGNLTIEEIKQLYMMIKRRNL